MAGRTFQILRLLPYLPTLAHPEILPHSGNQQIPRLVDPSLHTTIYAEPTQRHNLSPRATWRFPIKGTVTVTVAVIDTGWPPRKGVIGVQADGVRLFRIKVFWLENAETDIAGKIPGVFLALNITREVLSKVLLGSHDKG
jgi:hypothetical protein